MVSDGAMKSFIYQTKTKKLKVVWASKILMERVLEPWKSLFSIVLLMDDSL